MAPVVAASNALRLRWMMSMRAPQCSLSASGALPVPTTRARVGPIAPRSSPTCLNAASSADGCGQTCQIEMRLFVASQM